MAYSERSATPLTIKLVTLKVLFFHSEDAADIHSYTALKIILNKIEAEVHLANFDLNRVKIGASEIKKYLPLKN